MRLRLFLEERAVSKAAPEVNETAVTDLNIFIYNEEEQLVYYSYTESPGKDILLDIVPGYEYSVYAIANCGDLTGNAAVSDPDRLKELVWEIESVEDMTGASGAVPMSGILEKTMVEKGSTLSMRLTRLLSKFRITLDTSELDPEVNTFEVEEVRIRNINRRVAYFQESRAVTPDDVISGGIALEGEDLADIFTTGVDFYLPENIQGELLPGNTDEKTHVPSDFYSNLCTYVEIHVRYRSSEHYNDRLVYRYYLHDRSLSNFDVRRNTMYTCRTTFSGDGINETGWRIDVSAMKDLVTSISVSPATRKFTKEGETYSYSASVLPLSAEDPSITWSSDNPSVATVDQSGNVTAVWDGTCTITATANDGSGIVGKATVEVDVYKYPTSVKIYPEEVYMYHVQEVQLKAEVLPENATDKSIVWSTHNEWFDISPDGVLKMNNPEKFKYNSTAGYVFVSTAANSLKDTIYVKMSMMSISFEDVTIARGQSCDLQYLVNYDHDYEIEFEQLEGFEFFKLSGSVITTFNQHEFLAGRVVVRYKDYPTVDDYVWVTVD